MLIQEINNYSYYLIIIILLYNTYKFYTMIKYLVNKLLLEKYLYKNKYKKISVIRNIHNIRRNRINYIKKDKYLIKEDQILHKMFDYK